MGLAQRAAEVCNTSGGPSLLALKKERLRTKQKRKKERIIKKIEQDEDATQVGLDNEKVGGPRVASPTDRRKMQHFRGSSLLALKKKRLRAKQKRKKKE